MAIADDRGEFALKRELTEDSRGARYEVVDFGAHQRGSEDNIPTSSSASPGPARPERDVALRRSDVGVSLPATCPRTIRPQ